MRVPGSVPPGRGELHQDLRPPHLLLQGDAPPYPYYTPAMCNQVAGASAGSMAAVAVLIDNIDIGSHPRVTLRIVGIRGS